MLCCLNQKYLGYMAECTVYLEPIILYNVVTPHAQGQLVPELHSKQSTVQQISRSSFWGLVDHKTNLGVHKVR